MGVVIKRLYLANGQLSKPLSIKDDDIAMAGNIPDLLDTLNVGDYCYLTITEEDKLEVIRVERVTSWYEVYRAQDGTERQAFSTNARVVYKLTTQELKDAVDNTPLRIYPDGYGALEVNNSGNTWGIKYTDLNIKTLGGVSWMNPDYSQIVIVDNDGMFGCCDSDLTGAPYAGGQIFYLTSQLYATITFDELANNPKDNNGQHHSPLGPYTPAWLLDQPKIAEAYVRNSVKPMEWNMFGGAKEISNVVEGYIGTTISTLEFNLFGGAKEVILPAEGYIQNTCYPLEAQLFGNAVEYKHYKDQYISNSIKVLSVELS